MFRCVSPVYRKKCVKFTSRVLQCSSGLSVDQAMHKSHLYSVCVCMCVLNVRTLRVFVIKLTCKFSCKIKDHTFAPVPAFPRYSMCLQVCIEKTITCIPMRSPALSSDLQRSPSCRITCNTRGSVFRCVYKCYLYPCVCLRILVPVGIRVFSKHHHL